MYANAKDKSANKIITGKGLDIEFRAITFSAYGGFGASTHDLTKKKTEVEASGKAAVDAASEEVNTEKKKAAAKKKASAKKAASKKAATKKKAAKKS